MRKVPKVVTACEQCGARMERHPCHPGRFCSRACYGASRRGVPRGAKTVERICDYCHSAFQDPTWRNHRFCSYPCKVAAQTGVIRVQDEPCAFCGKDFKPYRYGGGGRTRYCSIKCGQLGRHRDRLGAENMGKNAPSRTKEQRNAYVHVRRARKLAAFVAPVDLRVIYERDGDKCGVCGKAISFEESTLDHIWPLSKGGTHEPSNSQIAHKRCNSRKINTGSGQLRLAL